MEDCRLGRLESDVASRHLQCCRSCLCQLRTDGLTPVSKYWTYWSHAGDMGLVSLVAYHQHMLGLSALLQWLCWERNWGESRRPISRAERWSREHFFLGAVYSSNAVDDFTKCCYMRTTWDTYGRGPYTDRMWNVCDVLIKFSLQGVHRFELPQLSDMSSACS
jgi:hypothetical protein